MKLKHFIFTLSFIMLFLSPGFVYSAEPDILKSFLDAYDANNPVGMSEVIEKNKDAVPNVIKTLIKESQTPDLTKLEKEEKLYIAELMAREYKNTTGDAALIIEVKKLIFNSMLGSPVNSTEEGGVNIIGIPLSSETKMNVFKPDNIVIKEGETVRWVNNDTVAHIFASMPLIGEGGIFTPSLEPGKTWEYKFEKPGEYFYLCFIHKGMVGKVTVVAAAAPAEKEKGSEKGSEKPAVEKAGKDGAAPAEEIKVNESQPAAAPEQD